MRENRNSFLQSSDLIRFDPPIPNPSPYAVPVFFFTNLLSPHILRHKSSNLSFLVPILHRGRQQRNLISPSPLHLVTPFRPARHRPVVLYNFRNTTPCHRVDLFARDSLSHKLPAIRPTLRLLMLPTLTHSYIRQLSPLSLARFVEIDRNPFPTCLFSFSKHFPFRGNKSHISPPYPALPANIPLLHRFHPTQASIPRKCKC